MRGDCCGFASQTSSWQKAFQRIDGKVAVSGFETANVLNKTLMHIFTYDGVHFNELGYEIFADYYTEGRAEYVIATRRRRRIVVCLASTLRLHSARHTPCFVRSRVAKTILNRFGLLAHDLRRRKRLAKVIRQFKIHSRKQKEKVGRCPTFSFWLRGWDLNLMTSGL